MIRQKLETNGNAFIEAIYSPGEMQAIAVGGEGGIIT